MPVRIIVVDQDEAAVSLLLLMLEHKGYDVRHAANGADALTLCDSATKVVVTGIVLPDMLGTQLAERAFKGSTAMKFVFVAGAPTRWPPSVLEPVFRIPRSSYCFLAKPFTADELEERIRAIRGAHHPVASREEESDAA